LLIKEGDTEGEVRVGKSRDGLEKDLADDIDFASVRVELVELEERQVRVQVVSVIGALLVHRGFKGGNVARVVPVDTFEVEVGRGHHYSFRCRRDK